MTCFVSAIVGFEVELRPVYAHSPLHDVRIHCCITLPLIFSLPTHVPYEL